MRSRRLLFPSLLLLLAAGSVPAAGAGDESVAALTNEDVVRMVAAGSGEEEIIRVLGERPAAFELDREMVGELRRAGVSEKILRAMRDRQAVAGVLAPVPPSVGAASPSGRVELVTAPLREKDRAPSFRLIRQTPRWAARDPLFSRKTEVEELALFVVCATPDHVPDRWTDRTALKDFLRHQLLVFAPGSRREKLKGFEVLALLVPESLEADLPPGTHRLLAGVAAKAGPDWHVVSSDEARTTGIVAGGTTRLRLLLEGGIAGSHRTGFREEQVVRLEPADGRQKEQP